MHGDRVIMQDDAIFCGRHECFHFSPFIFEILNTVRGRRPGNVPDRIAKVVLHGHEEAGPEEAAQGHPPTHQRVPGPLLRHLHVQKVLFDAVAGFQRCR